MNWKTFLKLDWRKVLFAVLMSIGTFSAAPAETFAAKIFACPHLLFYQFLPILEPGSIFSFLWIIVYPLIFWYLIFCIILLLHDRIKNLD